MDRVVFAQRLMDAVTAARDFARTMVRDTLPDAMTFNVFLNCSYPDAELHPDEVAYPEDDSREVLDCAFEETLVLLWRSGRVPSWVDVSVVGVTERHTRVALRCCGRFASSEAPLYHVAEGRPPFHVTSPALPPGWQQGQRFSLPR